MTKRKTFAQQNFEDNLIDVVDAICIIAAISLPFVIYWISSGSFN